jgi:hypothetical protein
MPEISNSAEIINMSEITDRVEALESDRDGWDDEDNPALSTWEDANTEDAAELKTLTDLLEEMCGYGGDHQWRGDWYPGCLVRDSYMRDYAEETAKDIGAIDPDASWPLNHIDWDAATEAFKEDYTSIEIDGVEYWYR